MCPHERAVAGPATARKAYVPARKSGHWGGNLSQNGYGLPKTEYLKARSARDLAERPVGELVAGGGATSRPPSRCPTRRCKFWVPEGSVAKNFGPALLCFRAKIDPGTPLDRRGLPGTSICTKNQPRRPILRPFRGTEKLPPDCLQLPGGINVSWISLETSVTYMQTVWCNFVFLLIGARVQTSFNFYGHAIVTELVCRLTLGASNTAATLQKNYQSGTACPPPRPTLVRDLTLA